MLMRLHVVLEDHIAEELTRKVPPRGRSAFIGAAVKLALQEETRWENLKAALGALRSKHAWNEDAAAWTRAQRRGDQRRFG